MKYKNWQTHLHTKKWFLALHYFSPCEIRYRYGKITLSIFLQKRILLLIFTEHYLTRSLKHIPSIVASEVRCHREQQVSLISVETNPAFT